MSIFLKQLSLLLTASFAFQQLHAQGGVTPMVAAHNYLVTHQEIRQKVQEGYFRQKPSTTIPADNFCITATEAKTWLYLQESLLPTDGRMPWWQELIGVNIAGCSNAAAVCREPNGAYTTLGTYLYEPGYDVNVNQFQRRLFIRTNAFWNEMVYGIQRVSTATARGTDTSASVRTVKVASQNRATQPAIMISDPIPGPLNRCGLWTCSASGSDKLPLQQWINIPVNVSIPTTKTYYIGMGGDNAFRLYVDGVLKIQFIKMGTEDYSPEAFNYWHIFPVTLTAGARSIRIEGYNNGNAASLGMEIYDNTPTELEYATSYRTLRVLFSTKDLTGNVICVQ